MRDDPDEYEIVNPSISILAQPSVAVVDDVVEYRGTRDVATEYLQYLYSDDAQAHRRGITIIVRPIRRY